MSDHSTNLRDTIHTLAAERGARKTLCPSEVARHLEGSDEKKWRLLMKPIRAQAVAMAEEGTIQITRKGKPVDPQNFKGIYRIRIVEGGPAKREVGDDG
jgi:hypothetical protein